MKKYRVYGIIPVINFIFLSLGSSTFLWVYIDSTPEQISEYLVEIVMLIILPLCLFICSFVTMWACVAIDEKGITKTLLGRIVRNIK